MFYNFICSWVGGLVLGSHSKPKLQKDYACLKINVSMTVDLTCRTTTYKYITVLI